jgi:hypothetical protein
MEAKIPKNQPVEPLHIIFIYYVPDIYTTLPIAFDEVNAKLGKTSLEIPVGYFCNQLATKVTFSCLLFL